MPAPIPVFDGHNDTLLHLYRAPGEDFFAGAPTADIDMARARKGDFAGGFFAIFLPIAPDSPPLASTDPAEPVADGLFIEPLPPALELPYAQRLTMGMAALLFRMEQQSAGKLKVVRSASELEACIRSETLATILHLEGAEAIDTNLDALEVFYQAGMRSLGLVWSRPNAFGHGVPFAFPHSPDIGPGLTDAGKALVRACNAKRIMIDLSHLNERGFWEVAALSDAPLVATHSNAHALCRASRNLLDKQLDAIKESDGMVGLNFAVCFLREDGANDADTPLETMVRHIDYLAERVGIDRVGLGSDFDGARMPRKLGDVAGLPKLLGALREHGFDDAALRKIAHENWVRVLRKTWGA